MTITFPAPPTPIQYGECKVYVRQTWVYPAGSVVEEIDVSGQPRPWVEVPELQAREIVWSVAPSMPTAMLSWQYGRVKEGEETEFDPRTKIAIDRWFVKIVADMHEDAEHPGTWFTREWVGIVMFSDDRQGGVYATDGDSYFHGEQLLTCHGMEQLLAEQELHTAIWRDGSTLYSLGRPLTFNSKRRDRTIGNRSATALSGIYQFAKDTNAVATWSTSDIVNYLLTYHTPADISNAVTVPFVLGVSLPTWDQPVLPTEGKTTYGLISQLIDRRRLRVWWLEYDGDNNRMLLWADTLTPSAVTLPLTGSPTVPANSFQEDLKFDESPYVTAAVRSPATEIVDQVIAYGAQRRCVGSFSYTDGTLSDGWTSAAEVAYKAGATGQAGYAALDRDKKQLRDKEARNRPILQNVYSYFVLPLGWNRKVKNGENGGTANFLFPEATDKQNYHELFVETSLPLLQEVDYSGTKLVDGTVDETLGTGQELEPLVFLKVPKKDSGDPQTWMRADTIGQRASIAMGSSKQDHSLGCNVSVPPFAKGIRVQITGGDQASWANYSWGTRNENDPRVGKYDYHEGMIVTLSIPEDQVIYGNYPAGEAVTEMNVRRKWIDCGEAYRETYVAPGTVIDVAADGSLVRSTGGYLPYRTGNHASVQLAAIAKMAFAYYGIVHYSLSLESRWLPSTGEIALGMLITDIGNLAGNERTVNTVVTELRLEWPSGTPDATEAPMFSLKTWAGELDAFQMALAPLPSPLRINQGTTASPFLSGETKIPSQITTKPR
jgi:hypothetical protein